MRREDGSGFQLRFGEQDSEQIRIYIVPVNTMIWPDQTGNGMVQNEFHAERIEERIRGLTGYRARSRVTLYYNGHTWSIPEGALFGAYPKNLHRKTLHPANK